MSTDAYRATTTYYSKRGIALLYVGETPMKPILTLENYSKWYGAELIDIYGNVSHVDPGVLDEVSRLHPTALHGDHGFTPHFLHRLAEHLGARADDRALEVAGARWLYEQEDMCDFFNIPK